MRTSLSSSRSRSSTKPDMEITFRPFREEDIPTLTALWNEVLTDGVAFPG